MRYQIKHGIVKYAADTILDDINFEIRDSEKIAVNCTDETLYEYANVQAVFESLGGYTYRQDLELMFQKFGFELDDLKRPVGTFSGGQQTRFAFIRLLLSRPDIMLLDEPTNHMDIVGKEALEWMLKKIYRNRSFCFSRQIFYQSGSNGTSGI